MAINNAFFNWSGGKDSALALWKVLGGKNYNVAYLLTSINAYHNRVSMHGVRRALLEEQVRSVQIPLRTIELPENPGMAEYDQAMETELKWCSTQGIVTGIYGDIFLEDLRTWREAKLTAVGMKCVFPLWKSDTRQLLSEFIQAGFKAIVVCTSSQYPIKEFCGRVIDEQFCDDLPATVDPCGENGEFHTFVFDGPIFSKPVAFKKGEIVYKEYNAPAADSKPDVKIGFYFCDILPVQQTEII